MKPFKKVKQKVGICVTRIVIIVSKSIYDSNTIRVVKRQYIKHCTDGTT